MNPRLDRFFPSAAPPRTRGASAAVLIATSVLAACTATPPASPPLASPLTPPAASLATVPLPSERTVAAPDGSDVRVLAGSPRGSMAHFTLAAGEVSTAARHRTVEELWYVLSGRGQMWRRLGDQAQVVALAPGLSLSIPVGTSFQFRAEGDEPLRIVGVTMPPWPGEGEAVLVEGAWAPTVPRAPSSRRLGP
jgi:mannose-6-phosphate isomerase-like protein (cupin superfamily)